jgi:transcription elongation factor Elf1
MTPMPRKADVMFLIFGIKRMARRLATVFALCPQCGSPAAQVVVRRTTWISLFFIPVVPLGTKYASTCTLCGVSTRLDKEQALRTVALAQQVADTSSGAGVAPPGIAQAPPAPSPPLNP